MELRTTKESGKMNITSKDIAERCGVSRGTVDRQAGHHLAPKDR